MSVISVSRFSLQPKPQNTISRTENIQEAMLVRKTRRGLKWDLKGFYETLTLLSTVVKTPLTTVTNKESGHPEVRIIISDFPNFGNKAYWNYAQWTHAQHRPSPYEKTTEQKDQAAFNRLKFVNAITTTHQLCHLWVLTFQIQRPKGSQSVSKT